MPVSALADKSVMQVPAVALKLGGAILDFALPPRCPGCGAVIPQPHEFCIDCWRSLQFLTDPCCLRCGLPFAYDQHASECGACLADPPKFDRLRAAVAYGDVARTVIMKLKYARRPGYAETVARFMDRHLAALSMDASLVPVPLHRWRIWKRGYNQSALIATRLAKRTGRPLLIDALERTRPTAPLRGKGRSERARTVSGAFQVADNRRQSVDGGKIILVDDVFTTGATVSACAQALRRAGAAEVNIICWARVIATDDR